MKTKDLTPTQKGDFIKYKLQLEDFFNEKTKLISKNTKSLYARFNAYLAALHYKGHFTPIKLSQFFLKKYRISSNTYSLLDNIENKNNRNGTAAAILKLIVLSITELPTSKAESFIIFLKNYQKRIRTDITIEKSDNKKTETEEKYMRTFSEYLKVAENLFEEYEDKRDRAFEEGGKDNVEIFRQYLPRIDFRNYLLISLIMLNRTMLDGVEMNSILRLIEYTDLYLWTKKTKPPINSKNYLSVSDSVIYLQHSKTTGGNHNVGLKKFKIYNPDIIDMLKLYAEIYNIKQNDPIFTSTFKGGDLTPLNKTALSKLLKDTFISISPHTTIGYIRKAYDTENEKFTTKQKVISASLNDHSFEVQQVFYIKK